MARLRRDRADGLMRAAGLALALVASTLGCRDESTRRARETIEDAASPDTGEADTFEVEADVALADTADADTAAPDIADTADPDIADADTVDPDTADTAEADTADPDTADAADADTADPDTADTVDTTPSFDPAASASAFFAAPDYDDTLSFGRYRARVGPDLVAYAPPPLADYGAPVFVLGTVIPLSSDTPIADLLGGADYHIAAVVDVSRLTPVTPQTYTNALIVGDTDGTIGLSLWQAADPSDPTPRAYAELWQYDGGSEPRRATIDVTGALDDAGRGRLVLQGKRAPTEPSDPTTPRDPSDPSAPSDPSDPSAPSSLWIRLGDGPWVRGDPAAPLPATTGTLRVGVSYANVAAIDGAVPTLALYPAAQADTFADAFVTWVAERHLGWVRTHAGDLPPAWLVRDGAHLVPLASGRLLMIGGWNPSDPWPLVAGGTGGGVRVTNEVWASDDAGATWELVLAHDSEPPHTGPGARFRPLHVATVGAWRGHAVTIGADVPNGEVWHESDDGRTWTLVASDAPSADRRFAMLGTLGDDLYLMGGQTQPTVAATADARVWRSRDGGVHWDRLADAPWPGRGLGQTVEHAGRLYVIAGGRYDETDVVDYNGVWSFDGATWAEVLPEGHAQFAPRFWHSLASTGARLWLINGYAERDGNLSGVLVSDDDGRTWATFAGGTGGAASHADATCTLGGRVLRVSGDLGERRVQVYLEDR